MPAPSLSIRRLISTEDVSTYGAWVRRHASGNLWQSLDWKTYQEALGRTTHLYGAFNGSALEAGALVVVDRTTGGFCTWELPRGPLWEQDIPSTTLAQFMKTMEKDARADRCLQLFFSPIDRLMTGRPSGRHVQPDATRVLDLTLNEETLLAQMKPKGRYNIGVAKKSGVQVRRSDDIAAFATLMRETTARDGFRAPSEAQFSAFLTSLPGSFLLLAYGPQDAQTPIAGLLGTLWGSTAVYYYGASSYEYRALMAPYLLQWEAMRYCKRSGCTSYDLLGIAPPNAAETHPWRGVSGFKEKFGGTVVTYPPERVITLRPLATKLLGWKRKILG